MNPLESRLDYPFGTTLPDLGQRLQVAPGVHWLRMPLPFALDHINLWLLEDEFEGRTGYTLIDCGIASDDIRRAWQSLFEDALREHPIVRVLCTHTHPDHLGNAGWLTARFDAPLWMTLGEYAMGRVLQASLPGTDGPSTVAHFRSHGLTDPGHIERLSQRTSYFPRLVPEIPLAYRRIRDGEHVRIGSRDWQVITGFGHSPEHASLYCSDEAILISGDMLLPRISTNVSVHAMEPEANPVEQFLSSIRRFLPLPAETLVLPSHGRPFRQLHERVRQLEAHHEERLDEVRALCARAPTSAADVVPVMFRRELDSHQIFFAFGEALAHLHVLWYAGEVRRERDAAGVYRFVSA